MIVVPQLGAKRILENGLDNLTAEVRLHLFQNDFNPTVFSVIGDFEEADYSGYALEVVTPDAWPVIFKADGSVVAVGPGIFFTPNAPTVANEIFGYYVTDDDNGNLLWCERFDQSKLMNGINTGFTLIPSFGGQSAVG